MFQGEFMALEEIRTAIDGFAPTPLLQREVQDQSLLAMEFIQLSSGKCLDASIQRTMGAKLAELHKHTSGNGKFGFDTTTYCGSTAQPNEWMDSWVNFWKQKRLGMMKEHLAFDFELVPLLEELVECCDALFEGVGPVQSSLLHGDLCESQ